VSGNGEVSGDREVSGNGEVSGKGKCLMNKILEKFGAGCKFRKRK